MFSDHRFVHQLRAFALGLAMLTGACTQPTADSCVDGSCNDPSRPFCDVDGAFDGTPLTCVAVACEPRTFQQCRGEQAITCNDSGTNYDLLRCERGCDDASGGCRLCEPNETACTNGMVATCDASGAVVEATSCPLGCFEDEPRCREIDPSNGLASVLDSVPTPSDVTLEDAQFVVDTGEVRAGGQAVEIPSFLIVTPGPTPDLRVFVVGALTLDGTTFVTADSYFEPGPAAAIVARGAVTVRGRVNVDPSAGSLADASVCDVGGVFYGERSDNHLFIASGGGGNATAGGDGGGITTKGFENAKGGQPVGTAPLEPLQGGCGSGNVSRGSMPAWVNLSGGGALQISSRHSISVDGVINVNGVRTEGDGCSPGPGACVYGGGAGGSLLLEAPTVILGSTARLLAKGAGGASALGSAAVPSDDEAATAGAPCESTALRICAAGGAGAAPGIPAAAGSAATYNTNPASQHFFGGGGGGGLGRIRINTRDGSYATSSESVEAGAATTAPLRTR